MHLADLPGWRLDRLRRQNIHTVAEAHLNPFNGRIPTLRLGNFPKFVRDKGLFMFSFVRHPFERSVGSV